MPNGTPVLVYFPRELVKQMDQLVKDGNYVSRSEIMRAGARLMVGQYLSEAVRETRRIREELIREEARRSVSHKAYTKAVS